VREWAGVLVVCGCAVLAGLLELFLVPLYSGSTLVPVTVLLAVASNVLLPRLSRALVPSTIAAVLPFLLWLVVIFAIGLSPRPEGDVVLPGGGGVQWVSYGVVVGGFVAGVVTVVQTASSPRSRVNR
jgi:hypothetical protein